LLPVGFVAVVRRLRRRTASPSSGLRTLVVAREHALGRLQFSDLRSEPLALHVIGWFWPKGTPEDEA